MGGVGRVINQIWTLLQMLKMKTQESKSSHIKKVNCLRSHKKMHKTSNFKLFHLHMKTLPQAAAACCMENIGFVFAVYKQYLMVVRLEGNQAGDLQEHRQTGFLRG